MELLNPSQITVEPGKPITLTYRFTNAVKTSADQWVFVHFVDGNGAIEFQDTHAPSVPTTQWTGAVNLTRTITVPATAVGTYRIWIGLYNQSTGARLPLDAGTSVKATNDSRYQIGLLHVQANILKNAGFESGWTSWSDIGNSTFVSGVGQVGTSVIRTGTGEGGAEQEVTKRVLPGSTYQIRGFMKMSAVTEEAWLGLEFEDANGQVFARQGVQVTTTAFVYKSLDFTVPAGTVKVFVTWWKAPGSSYAFLDDVSLVPVAPSAP